MHEQVLFGSSLVGLKKGVKANSDLLSHTINCSNAYTERRLRPWRRRAEIILRPCLVFIRARKPHVVCLLFLLGWYVRFTARFSSVKNLPIIISHSRNSCNSKTQPILLKELLLHRSTHKSRSVAPFP